MSDRKIQWHPGFVAAMALELLENKDSLIFQNEYNLNTRPLAVDLLIIKKEPSVQIANEVGAFFKGYNIMEYKSPEDQLGIDAFFKALAYASLYKSYGKTEDERKADDITVSLLRETKPMGLFRYFEEHGYRITGRGKGIYYIEGKIPFLMQIVVTGELDKTVHTWLRALSEKLEREDMKQLLDKIRQLSGKEERELADSVLEVSIEANKHIIEKWKEGDDMCHALMELMEPQLLLREKEGLEKGIEKGIEKGLHKGIQGTVDVLRELGYPDSEVQEIVTKKYALTIEEAKEYF